MISRRTLLKGLGTTVALPTLEAMLPLTAMASSAPKQAVRMAFLFVPNGMSMNEWTPKTSGALGELPDVLRPLMAQKSKISVLTGLSQVNAAAMGDGPGDHARSAATWLTGVHIKKSSGSDIKAAISVDQVAAEKLGKLTKFASLELGCERGGLSGDCDSGYSCAYSSAISWRGEHTPIAKEVNPRLVFERLFGSSEGYDNAESRSIRSRYNTSILDFVAADATSLRGKLGDRDRKKLDEYLEGVRDIEQRVKRFEQNSPVKTGVVRPTGVPQDFGEHIRLMGDMMILAFQSDLTRISTMMFANEGSNRSYAMVGVNEGHHEMSHHGMDPHKLEAKRQIDLFHVTQLAYILKRMDEIKEPTGTLLDNTVLVYGGGIGDGNRHNHDDLPILLAGRGGGTIQTGKHMVYQSQTPLNNLYLALLDRMGIPVETLGDSTGKLSPLF
ncbi:MAG: DUF1552 domain-containing protein [Armatimonadetes bacterium]|nr:DUF1552 domain-containing protein [Armatimonadota bacterium]